MNIIEVLKRENIGKSYEMFIDGANKGVWELVETHQLKELDFYRGETLITEVYFSSQLMRAEFEEVIDWSKVPVDTKMLVSKDNEIWFRRYFTKYEDGKIYCFRSGASSFSADDEDDIMVWKYVKLYQE